MLEVIIYAFIVAPIAFCILFIVFLTKSIKRGKRIKELERELNMLKGGYTGQATPDVNAQYYQQPVAQTYGQTEYIRLPEIQSNDYMPQQTAAVSQEQAYMPSYMQTSQPVYAPQPAVETPVQNDIPGQVPTPSWAVSPAQAMAAQAQTAQMVQTTPAPKKKVFSSINITFGIGVLFLTIVGATFMTVSWSWMSDALRAISLVAIVAVAYGLSFLAGKVFKLQQTGFAFYTLASMLGPIIVVGLGAFNLLGSAFSFKEGAGWLVATIAALILLISSIGGIFIFKEKVQTGVYRCTFYISLTWLVIFIAAQIGQSSSVTSEWSMVGLGLATLALVFRIISATGIFKEEKFFRVYSEIITYVPLGYLFPFIFDGDGAVFGATIIAVSALMLHAVTTKGREWIKYLSPVAGLGIATAWIGFGGTEEIYLCISVLMVIVFVLYAAHKILRISTILSDLLLPAALCMTSFLGFENAPAMGIASGFLALALIVYQMFVEPVLAEKTSAPEGIFKESIPLPAQIGMTVLGSAFYYYGASMICVAAKPGATFESVYFTLIALIPAVAAIVYRLVKDDDIRIFTAGISMSSTAVISGVLSCFKHGDSHTVQEGFCENIYVCAWILTLAVIVFCTCFIVKTVKEKKLSIGTMLWITLAVNTLSIGTLITVAKACENMKENEVETVLQFVSTGFLILNIIGIAAAWLMRKKKDGLIAEYGKGFKYFFSGFASAWFLFSWATFHSDWKFIVVSSVFAGLLYLFGSGFFAALPVLAAEIVAIDLMHEFENSDIRNVVCIGLTLLVALAGRLIFRKEVFSRKNVDYLTVLSPVLLFGLAKGEYVPMMLCLALALLVMNYAGRVKISVKVLISVFALLVSIGVICQPFVEIPDLIVLETDILILLGTLFAICRFIKPFNAVALKYIWFTGVALSLIAEGVSAAVTGEGLDLVIVGSASIGIFIYAFIRRNRLWFILGIVSILSIAVYLSVAFWSSLVWLIFLFVAGSVLVAMAAINEWGKRHSKDGKKKRFFEEWTW